MKLGILFTAFLLGSISLPQSQSCQADVHTAGTPAQDLHYGVTAHRGNSGNIPENTMAAFKSAIELNVDWVELDIHVTKDDKIVVIHDKTTGRTGNQDLVVANTTYEELKAVDVSVDFLNRKGEAHKDAITDDARHIPLLEEVLQLFATVEGTRLSIQPKTDCVKEAVELVQKYGLEESVGFNDGNLEYMREVKELAPEIHVFWDRPGNIDLDRDIEIALGHGFEAMVIHHSGITPEAVKKVTNAGLEIGSWTVNDADMMKDFLDIGVQRIYTDYPDLLIEVQQGR